MVNNDGKYVPQLTAELDLNSVAKYKALVYQIDTLTLGKTTTGVTITAFASGDVMNIAANGSVTTTVKTNAKKTLKNLYMNKVYTVGNSAGCSYDTENGWLMGDSYTSGDKIVRIVINPALTGEYSYTIKGLKAQLSTLDNRVVALDDVVVTKNGTAAATTTMTLTNSNLYNDINAPKLRLENSARPAVDGTSFNGQFTIVDKYGYEYYVNSDPTINSVKVVDEFGQTTTVPGSGLSGAKVSVAGLPYGYERTNTTPPYSYNGTWGFVINVTGAAFDSKYKKVRVTIDDASLTRIYDNAPATEDVTFELNLVNE